MRDTRVADTSMVHMIETHSNLYTIHKPVRHIFPPTYTARRVRGPLRISHTRTLIVSCSHAHNIIPKFSYSHILIFSYSHILVLSFSHSRILTFSYSHIRPVWGGVEAKVR